MDQFYSFLTGVNAQFMTQNQPRQLAPKAVDLGSTWVTHFAYVDWIRGEHSKGSETSDTVVNRYLLSSLSKPSTRLRTNSPINYVDQVSLPWTKRWFSLWVGGNPGRDGVGWKGWEGWRRSWKSWAREGRHQPGQPGETCRLKGPRPRLLALWILKGRQGDQQLFPKHKTGQTPPTTPPTTLSRANFRKQKSLFSELYHEMTKQSPCPSVTSCWKNILILDTE